MHASFQALGVVRTPARGLAQGAALAVMLLFWNSSPAAQETSAANSDTSPVLAVHPAPPTPPSNTHPADPLLMEKVTVGDTRMQRAQLEQIEKQAPLNPPFSLTKGGTVLKKKGRHASAQVGAQPYDDVLAKDAQYRDKYNQDRPISRLDLVRLQW